MRCVRGGAPPANPQQQSKYRLEGPTFRACNQKVSATSTYAAFTSVSRWNRSPSVHVGGDRVGPWGMGGCRYRASTEIVQTFQADNKCHRTARDTWLEKIRFSEKAIHPASEWSDARTIQRRKDVRVSDHPDSGPLSQRITSGVPRWLMIHSSTRVTRRLDNPVSTSIAGHSGVKMSTTVSMRTSRPVANPSATKSMAHSWLARLNKVPAGGSHLPTLSVAAPRSLPCRRTCSSMCRSSPR